MMYWFEKCLQIYFPWPVLSIGAIEIIRFFQPLLLCWSFSRVNGQELYIHIFFCKSLFRVIQHIRVYIEIIFYRKYFLL